MLFSLIYHEIELEQKYRKIKSLYLIINIRKNNNLVPHSIIFPLGSGNIIAPHLRRIKMRGLLSCYLSIYPLNNLLNIKIIEIEKPTGKNPYCITRKSTNLKIKILLHQSKNFMAVFLNLRN